MDGFVSLEVDPDLAYEQEETIEQAKLFELVDKNLYVKIPATVPGLGAIEESIAAGRSINVTLIFSLERHAGVAEAYIRGLERLVEAGGDPTHVVSVASFFVSRVDTEADRRLAEVGREDLGVVLRSTTRSSPTSTTARSSRAAMGGARCSRCEAAALPVGVDLDEEPGVPRRPLRRGADRAGHGEHDADRRGVPGSRRVRGDTLLEGVDEAALSTSSPRRASTTTTSRRRSSARASRSSRTRSRRSSRASTRSAPSRLAGQPVLDPEPGLRRRAARRG